MLVIKGNKKTSELIFTPNASPKKIEEKNIYFVFLYCKKYKRNKSDVKIKNIRLDSGVVKCACWISPGVMATKNAAIQENGLFKKKRLIA